MTENEVKYGIGLGLGDNSRGVFALRDFTEDDPLKGEILLEIPLALTLPILLDKAENMDNFGNAKKILAAQRKQLEDLGAPEILCNVVRDHEIGAATRLAAWFCWLCAHSPFWKRCVRPNLLLSSVQKSPSLFPLIFLIYIASGVESNGTRQRQTRSALGTENFVDFVILMASVIHISSFVPTAAGTRPSSLRCSPTCRCCACPAIDCRSCRMRRSPDLSSGCRCRPRTRGRGTWSYSRS